MSHTIYFDTETGGVLPHQPTIQLAAVAVEDGTWKEVSTFECKIQFDEKDADPEALKINNYSREAWRKEAVVKGVALRKFVEFSAPYRCVEMTSKRTGKSYSVGKLAGHNAASFDLPRLREMFGAEFFPFTYFVKDTLQRALWYFEEHPDIAKPASLKLSSLCFHFGIDSSGAHEALADVRMSVALAHAIMRAEQGEG